MQVSKISNNSFGKLYITRHLRNIIDNSSAFDPMFQETLKLKAIFKKKNLHNKEYVDVILDHRDFYGFIGSVRPKGRKYCFHNANMAGLHSFEKESIDSFAKTVEAYNDKCAKYAQYNLIKNN